MGPLGLLGFVGLMGLDTTSSMRGSNWDPMLDLWMLQRALCDLGEAPGVSMGVSTTLRSSMEASGAFSLRGSERLKAFTNAVAIFATVVKFTSKS